MDKRSEPRFAADRSLTITILGEREFQRTASVRNASGSGLGLFLAEQIAPGTALRIELDDDLLLGEVMYCRPMEGGYFLGVHLEQMLRGLSQLRTRFREFREEPERSRNETR